MRWIVTLFLLLMNVNAQELHPSASLTADGLVSDILVDGDTLYAATYRGNVDLFSIDTKQKFDVISLPPITDFAGDSVPAKIYSIDKLDDTVMIVSEGERGYRNVYLYSNGSLNQLIDSGDYLPIKKGVMIDANHLLLGLLSSEIILYRVSDKKIMYRRMIKEDESGGSAFSDMALNEDRTQVVTADESGEINLFNVKDFKHLKLFKGQNVDNVYSVDMQQGIVITAGQDQRCAIYQPNGRAYYMPGTFLIYAAALTPSGKHGLFAATIENEIELFSVEDRTVLAMLKGHNATLTDFAFVDETHFFSSAEEDQIYYWDIQSIK